MEKGLLKTVNVESWGKHCLLAWDGERWVPLFVGYYAEVMRLADALIAVYGTKLQD